MAGAADDTDVPEGWELLEEEGTGEYFYYHTETGETSWYKPGAWNQLEDEETGEVS